MKLVYIAGPYRAPTVSEIDDNIATARLFGKEVARLGAMPVIPHANTSHFDGIGSDQFWLDGTMVLMRACHAVYMMPDWKRSTGARAEMEEATKIGLPVFFSLSDLDDWLTEPAVEKGGEHD